MATQNIFQSISISKDLRFQRKSSSKSKWSLVVFRRHMRGVIFLFSFFFQFGEIVVKCGHAQCCSFFIGLILCLSDHISSIFLFTFPN